MKIPSRLGGLARKYFIHPQMAQIPQIDFFARPLKESFIFALFEIFVVSFFEQDYKRSFFITTTCPRCAWGMAPALE